MMYLSPAEVELIHLIRNVAVDEPVKRVNVTFSIHESNIPLTISIERDFPESDQAVPSDDKQKELESILGIFNDIESKRLEAERLEKENQERLISIINELPDSSIKRRLLYILAPEPAPQLT